MQKKIRIYWDKFCSYLELHLVITLCTLPVVVGWGLPISLLSLFGNLYFTPVLSLFLLVSCAIFFFEILHIPNSWCIWLLEQITHWWHTILQCNSPYWLIGVCKAVWPYTLLIACAVFFMYTKRSYAPRKRQILLLVAFASICLVQWVHLQFQKHSSMIIYKRSKMVVFRYHGKTTLFDIGLCNRLSYPEKWIEYTLKPHLFLHIGSYHIDRYVALKPSDKTDYFKKCLLKSRLLKS